MKEERLVSSVIMRVFCIFLGVSMLYADDEFYTMTYNKSNDSVFHSFGVHTAYMTTIADAPRVQKIQEKARYFVQKFEQSYEFIPMIKTTMAREEIPQEFLFLAMAESGFTPTAKSSKKAIGIWQIMPATARGLGLEINRYIDERKDPIRSTQAASQYLKSLYEATGEWYLAAMAYNCGLGRLKRAIDEAGGDSRIETLLDEEAQYLPAETRNYIRTILAISLLFNDVDFLKSNNVDYLLNRGATDSLVMVSVKGGTSLNAIAKSAKMSLAELQKYNKHFTHSTLPPGNKRYNVYIPYDNLRFFKQRFNERQYAKQNTTDSLMLTHIVQKGENLGSIARDYRVLVSDIQALNNIDGTMIKANQKLIIPQAKSTRLAQGDGIKDSKEY